MALPDLLPPRQPEMRGRKPLCRCGKPARLVTGDRLYRRGALAKKLFWWCETCDASVGCHPGTKVPLGTLATREQRAWRRAVHAAFDPLWQEEGMERNAAYAWLADLLGIAPGSCHIGWMNEEWCRRALIAISWMRPAYREGG